MKNFRDLSRYDTFTVGWWDEGERIMRVKNFKNYPDANEFAKQHDGVVRGNLRKDLIRDPLYVSDLL